MKKDSPDQKAEKCRREVQATLDKHNCAVIATPMFTVKKDGSLKVATEVTIVPLIKPKSPKYMN